jgi:cysteine synthase A
MKHETILSTIGRTPVVRLNKMAPGGVNIFMKLESFNPMGSVKDRMALATIEAAEKSGQLRPGQTVIEATSGNTGIALAMVCAAKGYPLVVTMAENFSVERRRLMRFLGARVVLTPAALKGSGMLAKAGELAEKHGWFFVRQFENEANAAVHARTTAREILEDFAGERLDAWVTGTGTGGTLKGVASVLRVERPETRVIACEPANSPVLGSGVPQVRSHNGDPLGSHPSFKPHPIQGWSPDFIPRLTEDAMDLGYVDRVLPIEGDDAMRMARQLATEEGILAGISGGATLAGAVAIARELPAGANVLCMIPDTGERYLSTPLFADVPTEMSDEELAFSRSTPGARFDVPALAVAPPVAAARQHTDNTEAETFVRDVIGDASQPVVMFAMQWCEFCWSVRRLFDRLQVRYRSVDLDSVEFQARNRGERIREALNARTAMSTIPQIFIGGRLIGGCTDIFDAWRSGQAQQLLDANGVTYQQGVDIDARAFLPGWLHPR